MGEVYAYEQVPDYIELLPDGRPDYPMGRNLKVPLECTGMEIPSMPFADKTSAQRMNMYTTSAQQALIVRGAEFPQVASGSEREYMKYTFNATRFTQPGMILAAIPRYRPNVGADPIRHCPTWLVVYYGEEDKKVHSMWVTNYNKGTNGFGWQNFIDRSKLMPGSRIEKGETISRSNAVQGSRYCKGMNVNVCYTTLPGTVEDALIISDEFAARSVATGYTEMMIEIDKHTVPLNYFGNPDNYKFIPDIGERIGEGDVVCALRKVDKLTYFADMTPTALTEIQPLHDKVMYHSGANGTIVDIEVFRNPSRKILTPPHIFSQLDKYESETQVFQEQVLKIYQQECVEKKRIAGHTFSTVVRSVGKNLSTVKKKVFGSSRKTLAKYRCKELPISHILLRVVIKYDIYPSRGSKYCSFWGDKGVISDIVPKEHMPVNDHGVRADLIASPMGIPNRMNAGQLYVTFLSEMCRVTLDAMRAAPDLLTACDIMFELFRDINPEYANVLEQEFSTDADRRAFVNDAFELDYLILVVPPFLDNITADWVYDMTRKYNITRTPIEFNQLDADGKVVRRIRTKRDQFIGKKYVFMLCKVPFCKSSGMGYVNDLGVPITVKDSTIKAQNPVSPTSIRAGEDEIRNLLNNLGATLTSRILGVNATSPEVTQQLAMLMLTSKHPTAETFVQVSETEIANSSRTISALHAMLNV